MVQRGTGRAQQGYIGVNYRTVEKSPSGNTVGTPRNEERYMGGTVWNKMVHCGRMILECTLAVTEGGCGTWKVQGRIVLRGSLRVHWA
jgi:hypothetical protein